MNRLEEAEAAEAGAEWHVQLALAEKNAARIGALESDRAALLAIVREYFLWVRCHGLSGMQSVNKLIVSLPEALKKEVTGG